MNNTLQNTSLFGMVISFVLVVMCMLRGASRIAGVLAMIVYRVATAQVFSWSQVQK